MGFWDVVKSVPGTIISGQSEVAGKVTRGATWVTSEGAKKVFPKNTVAYKSADRAQKMTRDSDNLIRDQGDYLRAHPVESATLIAGTALIVTGAGTPAGVAMVGGTGARLISGKRSPTQNVGDAVGAFQNAQDVRNLQGANAALDDAMLESETDNTKILVVGAVLLVVVGLVVLR